MKLHFGRGFDPYPLPLPHPHPPPPTPSSPNHGPIAEIFTRCSITLENHRAIQIRQKQGPISFPGKI